MKEVTERPTSGQWVEMWSYNGNVWSNTFKFLDGGLLIYLPDEDSWSVTPWSETSPPLAEEVKFFVAGSPDG